MGNYNCLVSMNMKGTTASSGRCPDREQLESAEGKGAWVRVVMGEGHKRQIRETCKQLGLPVVCIVRTRIGSLRPENPKPRQWRYRTREQIDRWKGKNPEKRIGRR